MQFVKRRQNDPEYLKSVIMQKDITIEQEKRKNDELTKHNDKLKGQYDELFKQKQHKEDALTKEMANLTMAINVLQSQIQILKHEKNQSQFLLNNFRLKGQETQRQHKNQNQKHIIEYEAQKQLLNNRINILQKNLHEIKKYYKLQEHINDDRKKIIEDSNRDLKGFSNQKQERLLIIQNQQFKNEIQYQSQNITIQVRKNEKLQEKIRSLKSQLQLHKQIQNDLVKRSSLAQTLIKKLYKEMQDMKKNKAETNNVSLSSSHIRTPQSENDDAASSRGENESIKDKTQTINKLKFEVASLKNYNHYMENMQKIYSKKYETLGSLLVEYLQNLLYSNESEGQQTNNNSPTQISLNINELRTKDIKEWQYQQMEAIIHLILNQLKPFISKSSLIHFPEPKNINISFVEENPKEIVSLPKIAGDYEKSYQKQAKKGQNRFKDVPIDISTKILRSNLRQWGSKIKYGNMPMIRKLKSKSIMQQNQKSFL